MKESLDAARRTLSMTRLEMAKLSAFLGREPWTIAPNATYESATDTGVTVIITLFNYADYIQQCLDSVCAAKIDNIPGGFEVVVIDDCSTDQSANLVEQYIQQTDVPICLVRKLFNTGLADARNVGLRLSRSPYVFILDADNWIYPNCLSVLYDTIHQSNCAAVYSIISRFDSDTGEGCGLVSCYEWDVQELVNAAYIDAMAMFRRETLEQMGGYSVDLMEVGWCGWEDYDLWLKLAQSGYECKLVPQILSAYRSHPHSMISTTNHYSYFIVKHFSKKFSKLVTQYSNSPRLFGLPRHEVFANTPPYHAAEPTPSTAELERLRKQLKRTRAELEETKQAFEQAKGRIEAMETSKFWKLRRRWFGIKRSLGLLVNE